MQVTQGKTQDAGRRVQGFLDTHATAIGTAVPPELRVELDTAVSQFAAYQQEQETNTAAARGETANQIVLRADVYERFLKPIAKIVARKLPEAPNRLELIVPARALRTQAFVTKASAAADAAAAYVPTFVAGGLGADFIPQMKAAIAKITASSDLRARQLARKSTATDQLKAADTAVKMLIDHIGSVITPALKGNSDALSDWNASKRIHQTAVSPLPTGSLTLPSAEPTPTQTLTPTPTPSATPEPAPTTSTLMPSAIQSAKSAA